MATCPHCGTVNADKYTFCMSCGKALKGAAASAPNSAAAPEPTSGIDDLLEAGIVCPKCDTYNDPGRRTCISCGESLSGLTEFLLPVSDTATDTGAAQQEKEPLPRSPTTPAAGPLEPPPQPQSPAVSSTTSPEFSSSSARAVSDSKINSPRTTELQAPRRDTAQLHSVSAPADATSICPFCQSVIPADSRVCFSCGKSLALQASQVDPAPDVSIRLRLVRGYGREDSTLPIGPKGVTIGRSQAIVSIQQDPFLSPCHLKIFMENGELFCQDQGSLNGTFLRTRSNEEIKQGTEFITGNQRFYLLGLGGPTTDVRINVSNDTRAYGGPVPKQLFVALRLHYADSQGKPVAGAVLLRSGPLISIGKHGCDLNFPGDPAMAQLQCERHLKPSGIQLREKGTSTGVFVRIKDKKPLKNGDEILIGDEVFRIEIG